MATAKEKESIDELKDNFNTLDKRTALMGQDLSYVKKDLKKVVDFIENNKRGITTSSILDNKIVTYFLGAAILAVLYFLSKGAL